MADSSSLNLDLQSQDEAVVERTLDNLATSDTSGVEPRMAQSIFSQCTQKLLSPNLSVRSKSLAVLVKFLDEGGNQRGRSRTYLKKEENLCKIISQPEMLDLNLTKDVDDHQLFHRNLCKLVSHLQNLAPKLLFQNGFKSLSQYLLACTAHADSQIAMAGTMYWAELSVPPVPPKCMDAWVPSVLVRLKKIVPALLRNMIYSQQHTEFLLSGSSGAHMPAELEQCSDLRNYAALGFENLCRIFQNELTALFKPILMQRLESDKWQEVEGILLALSAFIQALGLPREMHDIYPAILQRLLEFYSHKEPLIRAITCFTVQYLVNQPMKGVKDPFAKMIKCSSALLSDNCAEVQVMAARSLANTLAYAERDLTPHLKKIITALTKTSSSFQGEARYPFYECVGHLYGRMGPVLEQGHSQMLLDPIIRHWQALLLDPAVEDSSEEVIMVCQPLCVIAINAKDSFQPHNVSIFEKASAFLESIIRNGTAQHNGDSLTTMLVAVLDLTSAVFEGQGQQAASEMRDHKLAPLCLNLLQISSLDDKVHQSVLALLGHISQNSYDEVRPILSGVLSIIKSTLDNGHVDNGLKNNALWALGIMAKCESTQNDQIFSMFGQLVDMVKQTDGDIGCVINAALAFTNLCAKWPEQTIGAVVKGEIIHYLCSLMQTEFPRDLERDTIFKNICTLIMPHIQRVDKKDWGAFCTAAAMIDTQDSDLLKMLRHMMKDLRNHLGNKGWNKVCQEVGPQLAIVLRKRYKLY